jgi:glycosyltransferase involved in cell wall biosynthesis
MMANFLICFHTPANEGYAIAPLEKTFFDVIKSVTKDEIHLGYKNFVKGKPSWFNEQTSNFLELDYDGIDELKGKEIVDYLRSNSIKYVLGFDLPIGSGLCKTFRQGGVNRIISYYGCPMSSINKGIKLLLKRIQIYFTNDKPDHLIFESFGMQKKATHGRGIKSDNTSVVRLGIDINEYSNINAYKYVHNILDIPANFKVIFYAGHMERRKGVDVIIKAAAELINKRDHNDLHFYICGNRLGEEKAFDSFYKDTKAENFITFGGYRNDLPEIMSGCTLGVIASTGWDSFPRSSLEMAISGLPLLVSDLPGLNETIVDGTTGFLFSPGDHMDLAEKIENLSENSNLCEKFSKNAVKRVLEEFTLEKQKERLIQVIQNIIQQH